MTTGTTAEVGTTPTTAPTRRRTRPVAPIWIALGIGGWLGLAWLVSRMYAADAKGAGFDLELILQAGRDLASGQSPYRPDMLAGAAPESTTLFFSYPPHVAQVTSLLSGLSMPVVLTLLWIAAAAGIAVIAILLRARLAPTLPLRSVVLPAVAISPFCLSLATGLLFGNVNVLFPLAYGLILLAAIGTTTADRAAGGVALAIASLTKLHPGSLGLWFLVRGFRERRAGQPPHSWGVIVVALLVALVILAISLLAGGVALWSEYASVIRAGSQAAIVDTRNAGPASQIAIALGQGDATARLIQIPVTLTALLITIWAAWTRDDPIESVAWAAAASLATLPVTWYHYPAAFIPFAIAAALRAHGTTAFGRTIALVFAGLILAGLAISWLPLEWVGIGCVIAAVRLSAPRTTARPVTAPAAA
jgi:hypothetical protein